MGNQGVVRGEVTSVGHKMEGGDPGAGEGEDPGAEEGEDPGAEEGEGPKCWGVGDGCSQKCHAHHVSLGMGQDATDAGNQISAFCRAQGEDHCGANPYFRQGGPQMAALNQLAVCRHRIVPSPPVPSPPRNVACPRLCTGPPSSHRHRRVHRPHTARTHRSAPSPLGVSRLRRKAPSPLKASPHTLAVSPRCHTTACCLVEVYHLHTTSCPPVPCSHRKVSIPPVVMVSPLHRVSALLRTLSSIPLPFHLRTTSPPRGAVCLLCPPECPAPCGRHPAEASSLLDRRAQTAAWAAKTAATTTTQEAVATKLAAVAVTTVRAAGEPC